MIYSGRPFGGDKMRRKKDEYFIGMVDNFAASQRYSKNKKRRTAKLYLKRGLLIALCVLILAGLAAGTYFFVIPAVSGWISSWGATADEVTPDEATADEAPSTTAEATTEAPTEPPTTVPVTTAPTAAVTNLDFVTPAIPDDGTDGTLYSSTLYLYKNTGYNLFFSTDKVAKHYASAVNKIAAGLRKDITVYNMVVPNHTEFGLPTRIGKSVENVSQADNIRTIYENLDKRVTPINCYNALSTHNSEYIYYNTDHHWTSLGAYYGYTAFCEQTGLDAIDVNDLRKNSIEGFTGSFYTLTGNSGLYSNADTVIYYDLPVETSAKMKERMSSDTINCDVYYPAATSGTLTYGVFCWGDTAQFVISSNAGTGKKIAVVKDSYGNAFAPYLTAHYDEVHLLDFRYWDGNLGDYLKNNGIDEVLIINNTMSANSTSQVNSMSSALS